MIVATIFVIEGLGYYTDECLAEHPCVQYGGGGDGNPEIRTPPFPAAPVPHRAHDLVRADYSVDGVY